MDGSQPARPSPLAWTRIASLNSNASTLQHLVNQGKFSVLDPEDVRHSIRCHMLEQHAGGEAEVCIVTWAPVGSQGSQAIPPGTRVAVKLYHRSNGGNGFLPIRDEFDRIQEVAQGLNSLRKEVNVMHRLQQAGLKTPQVLGIVQHHGDLRNQLLWGYVMPAYQHGSLYSFMHRTCHRQIAEGVFPSFFAFHKLAGHYEQLHSALLRFSSPGAGQGLLLQDISSNNLLVSELVSFGAVGKAASTAAPSCELLFADPSQAQIIGHLQKPQASCYVVSTWLWGSLSTRYGMVDPLADLYSLNVVFLELWMVAEGGPVPLKELVQSLAADGDRSQGWALARALCVAMLRRHVCGGGIQPRNKREVPLSWLLLWSLLLGTDDLRSGQELASVMLCRRPSVADMAQVAARLSSIATAVEELGGSLTSEILGTASGAAMVTQCVELYGRLVQLSQLEAEPATPASLLPADDSLVWVATHFMAQEHPLVAAMREQGVVLVCGQQAPPLAPLKPYLRNFQYAVHEAQGKAKWIGGNELVGQAVEHAAVAAEDRAAGQMRGLSQAFLRLREAALRLAPDEQQRAELREAAVLPPELDAIVRSTPASPSGPLAPPTAAPSNPAAEPERPAGQPPAAHPASGCGSMASPAAAAPCSSLVSGTVAVPASMPATPTKQRLEAQASN